MTVADDLLFEAVPLNKLQEAEWSGHAYLVSNLQFTVHLVPHLPS